MKTKWKTAPISPTCEHLRPYSGQCDEPTSWVYPAAGSGWMSLCDECAQKHHPHVTAIEEVIEAGETFA